MSDTVEHISLSRHTQREYNSLVSKSEVGCSPRRQVDADAKDVCATCRGLGHLFYLACSLVLRAGLVELLLRLILLHHLHRNDM